MRKIYMATLCLLLILGCSNQKPFEYNSPNFKLIKLSKGVFACIHKLGGKAICNSGIVDNGKETIIFDTFLSPNVAQELIKVVEKLQLSPIKYVVNSHFHNDHIRGNQVFSDKVDIVSTKRTAELIGEVEPEQLAYEKEFAEERFNYYDSLLTDYKGDSTDIEFTKIQMWHPYYEVLNKSHLEIKTRLPNMFVEDEINLDGPERTVQLISKGRGHTESDLILYLPDDRIVFTGDLVFIKSHPYLGHGFPKEHKESLLFINSLEVSTVIPGHGEIGNKNDVYLMRNYIDDVKKIAQTMIDKSMSKKDANKMEIPPQYSNWLFERFFVYNLKFMYSYLSENK